MVNDSEASGKSSCGLSGSDREKEKCREDSKSPSRRKHKKSKHSKKKLKKKSSKRKRRHKGRSRSRSSSKERPRDKSPSEPSHTDVKCGLTEESVESTKREVAGDTSVCQKAVTDELNTVGKANNIIVNKDTVSGTLALNEEEVEAAKEKNSEGFRVKSEKVEEKNGGVDLYDVYDPGLYFAERMEQEKDIKNLANESIDTKDIEKRSESRFASGELSSSRGNSESREINASKEKSSKEQRSRDIKSTDRKSRSKERKSRSKGRKSRSKDGSRSRDKRSRSAGKRSRSKKRKSRSKQSESRSTDRKPKSRERKSKSNDRKRNRREKSRSKEGRSRSRDRRAKKRRSESEEKARKTLRERLTSRRRSKSRERRKSLSSERRSSVSRYRSSKSRRSRSNERRYKSRSRSYDKRRRSRLSSNDRYRRSRSGRRRSRSSRRRSRSGGRRCRSRSLNRNRRSSSRRRYRSKSRSPQRSRRSKSQDDVAASVPVNLTRALGVPTSSLTTTTASDVKPTKSIADFTALCKQITESKEEEVNTSEENKTKEDKVSHPFSVKPAKEIVIPPVIFPVSRPTEPDRPLEQAFPVSRGNQHKTKENTNESTVGVIDGSIATAEQVFKTNAQKEKLDVSGLIAKRMEAQNRLQSNPQDFEAKLMLEEVQMKMQNWASVNLKPGQFTGESLVSSVVPKENINSGYQAWARKDMFHNLAPIRGGVGMKLLQKMGWQPGQVLGKRGEGSYEPIALNVKMDRKGLVSFAEAGSKGKGGKGGGRNMAAAQAVQEKILVQLLMKLEKTKLFEQVYIIVFGSTSAGCEKVAQLIRLSAIVHHILMPLFLCLSRDEAKGQVGKHPVSALAELCTKKRWSAPTYKIAHESGPAHKKDFLFKVVVNGISYQHNIASNNKKHAKAESAFVALKALGVLPQDAVMSL